MKKPPALAGGLGILGFRGGQETLLLMHGTSGLMVSGSRMNALIMTMFGSQLTNSVGSLTLEEEEK